MTITPASRRFGALLAALTASIAAALAASAPVHVHAHAQTPDEAPAAYCYPTDDPAIDPVPARPAALSVVRVYDFADPNATLDWWSSSPGTTLSIAGGALVAESTELDPYVFTPDFSDVPAGQTLVKLRLRRSGWDEGRLYYAEEARPDFDEVHSIAFEMTKEPNVQTGGPIPDDLPFRDYVVSYCSDSPTTKLRLDPGNSPGRYEVERIEILSVGLEPLKFGTASVDSGTITTSLLNAGDAPATVEISCVGAEPAGPETLVVPARGAATITRRYPTDAPFHDVELAAARPGTDAPIRRRFFTFNESACAPLDDPDAAGETITIRSSKGAVRFAADGSGAELFRGAERVGVLRPRMCEDGDGAELTPNRFTDEASVREALGRHDAPTRLALGTAAPGADESELVFPILERQRGAADAGSAEQVGTLRFRLDDDVLAFSVTAPRRVHAPVLRALGTMKQAILPGVEYLEEGEHSSSSADLTTSARVRFAPPWSWITQPYAAIATDRGALTELYEDGKAQAFFAVPDFLDGDAASSRFNVAGAELSGKIRVAAPEPVEESVLWAVRTLGLPSLPEPPKSGADLDALILGALQSSAIVSDEGWVYTVFRPEGDKTFQPGFGCDFVSNVFSLTGRFPSTPRVDVGGAYIHDRRSLLLTGNGDKFTGSLAAVRQRTLAAQREDGSFRYSGRFLRGSAVDYASGHSGSMLWSLAEDWRLTGNKRALAGLLRGLDFVNRLRTPRGGQTWEVPLHTPDILGASRCTLANVGAYEATGDAGYLAAARRWAISGLPFVYLWEAPGLEPGRNYPEEDAAGRPIIMKYATIAVYGATEGNLTQWFGRPVQWCGLDYALALILLAKYDATLDWARIADGIVSCAECQLHDGEIDAGFNGLLPDSVDVATQRAYACYFPPTSTWVLRNMLSGREADVSVADVNGLRIAAPFPCHAEGNELVVEGKAGVGYQIVLGGEEIREIESQGVDRIRIAGAAK